MGILYDLLLQGHHHVHTTGLAFLTSLLNTREQDVLRRALVWQTKSL